MSQITETLFQLLFTIVIIGLLVLWGAWRYYQINLIQVIYEKFKESAADARDVNPFMMLRGRHY